MSEMLIHYFTLSLLYAILPGLTFKYFAILFTLSISHIFVRFNSEIRVCFWFGGLGVLYETFEYRRPCRGKERVFRMTFVVDACA